ncbi:MacS family sensor histidine kinase [Kitasatospora sp. NPDC048296]|jgi:signal transduction histidine kinase|uniref:MacS family sensor histidine kinase n=1 Tax=Kitasatospora sp. NPDC048296 TaxID=3364048 RepID=UPI00371D95E5
MAEGARAGARGGTVAAGGMSVELPLWKAISYFRVLALCYALLRYFNAYLHFLHPVSGWIFLGALTLWTLASTRAFADPQRCTWFVLGFDLALAVTGIVMSGMIDAPARISHGALTLPTIWAAGSVLGCAAKGGWRPSAAAGSVIGIANILGHGGPTGDNIHNIVLLLVAGIAIGYVIELARASEATLARALQVEAATRERERLSRDIHDGVLQVLALVQRRGVELGEGTGGGADFAELGRLAGEQERALRALMTGGPLPAQRAVDLPEADAAEPCDLTALLRPYADERITLSAPGTPVLLPGPAARELAAAVGAAVDNVRKHAGEQTRAWILVEDEPAAVTVSIRDEGPGFAPGRLGEAERAGRLGVSQSIRGRLLDLGGTAELYSAPGEGVEVELRVPREGF